MGENHYRVVFHGRENGGFDRDKVTAGLSTLFKTTPDKIRRLFNGSSSVIKSGLKRQEAERYLKTLSKVGAHCSLEVDVPEMPSEASNLFLCPKCSYRATGPDDPIMAKGECPSCGIIVAKYKPPEKRASDALTSVTNEYPEQDKSRFSFDESRAFFHFVTLEYHLETEPVLPAAVETLDNATLFRRGWASVATFFHWFVMSVFLQFPTAVIVALFFDYDEHIRETIIGISAIVAIFVSMVLMPLIWKGHTYGQRAMKIFLVSDNTGKIGLTPAQVLIRAPLSLLKFAFGIVLIIPLFRRDQKSVEDIVGGVRQLSAENKLTRPWNIALKPVMVFIFFLIIQIPFNMALVSFTEIFSLDNTGSKTMVQMKQQAGPMAVRNYLTQLRTESFRYLYSTGRFPVTEEQIQEFLDESFNSAHVIHRYHENGRMEIREKHDGLEIGLMENGFWYVIDSEGFIREYRIW